MLEHGPRRGTLHDTLQETVFGRRLRLQSKSKQLVREPRRRAERAGGAETVRKGGLPLRIGGRQTVLQFALREAVRRQRLRYEDQGKGLVRKARRKWSVPCRQVQRECEAPPGLLLEARGTRRVLHHPRLRDPVRPRDAGLRQTRCERDLRGIWMYRPLNAAEKGVREALGRQAGLLCRRLQLHGGSPRGLQNARQRAAESETPLLDSRVLNVCCCARDLRQAWCPRVLLRSERQLQLCRLREGIVRKA